LGKGEFWEKPVSTKTEREPQVAPFGINFEKQGSKKGGDHVLRNGPNRLKTDGESVVHIFSFLRFLAVGRRYLGGEEKRQRQCKHTKNEAHRTKRLGREGKRKGGQTKNGTTGKRLTQYKKEIETHKRKIGKLGEKLDARGGQCDIPL